MLHVFWFLLFVTDKGSNTRFGGNKKCSMILVMLPLLPLLPYIYIIHEM
jgi:hypothetical protein